ncbi:MAG TPA: hypothetical protein VFN51_02660 [Candidatus Saccharimonadales bacterium]|nr:hypothetical protein [Candidatus Saccharimonadales bacterium]
MSATVIGVAMLVIGVLIGFGITKAMDHNSNNSSSTNSSAVALSDTKANTLRMNLVTLGIDHMTLTDQAVDAALDGSPDASAFGTALNDNGTAIGAAVGSVYGSSAQNTFDKVWQLHLNDFVKYAVADKAGDAAAKTAALSDINTNYTMPLAQFLAKANPNLPEATLQSALNDHIQMTAQMIDYHVQGNYTAEANELNMANTHIAGLFNTLANGIIKQYPSKF